jgi:hypothetical protein
MMQAAERGMPLIHSLSYNVDIATADDLHSHRGSLPKKYRMVFGVESWNDNEKSSKHNLPRCQ